MKNDPIARRRSQWRPWQTSTPSRRILSRRLAWRLGTAQLETVRSLSYDSQTVIPLGRVWRNQFRQGLKVAFAPDRSGNRCPLCGVVEDRVRFQIVEVLAGNVGSLSAEGGFDCVSALG